MIKIAVSGSNGKMGSRIKRLAEEMPGIQLAGAFDVGDDALSVIRDCDCLIEFTNPEATVKNLGIAKRLGKAVVIGTTGLDKKKRRFIEEAASEIPIVFSPNTAVGVNLLFKLTQRAASVLGGSYAVSISETHHVHKKDAPSGTAKRLHNIIAKNMGIHSGEIKIESHRTADVVGDHTVLFNGREESLEITHHAKSRDLFARGALTAACFIVKKKPGLYGMDEVLGIKD